MIVISLSDHKLWIPSPQKNEYDMKLLVFAWRWWSFYFRLLYVSFFRRSKVDELNCWQSGPYLVNEFSVAQLFILEEIYDRECFIGASSGADLGEGPGRPAPLPPPVILGIKKKNQRW